MTPKEKAKEIYFSMLNAGKGFMSEYLAGECAMIAVEELVVQADTEYFKKVKRELKKLLHHKGS